jgi:hypothetical protein
VSHQFPPVLLEARALSRLATGPINLDLAAGECVAVTISLSAFNSGVVRERAAFEARFAPDDGATSAGSGRSARH